MPLSTNRSSVRSISRVSAPNRNCPTKARMIAGCGVSSEFLISSRNNEKNSMPFMPPAAAIRSSSKAFISAWISLWRSSNWRNLSRIAPSALPSSITAIKRLIRVLTSPSSLSSGATFAVKSAAVVIARCLISASSMSPKSSSMNSSLSLYHTARSRALAFDRPLICA